MGGGDKRPDDSGGGDGDGGDGDEYEDREPDSQQVELSYFDSDGGDGDSGSDGGSDGGTGGVSGGSGGGNGGDGSGSTGTTEESGKSDIVDRVKGYADGEGEGDGESDDGGNNSESDSGSGGLAATRSLLAVSGIGMSIGMQKPTTGDKAVEVSEDAVERLYEEAREEVGDELPHHTT